MSESRNFYYGKTAQIVAGSANFSTLITANPSTFSLVAAQATAFAALNTTLQATYTAAITPSTRTPVAVEANQVALRNMRANAILLSKIIRASSTVTDAQLVTLGLVPRRAPVPRPVPAVPPQLELVSVMGRVAKVRYHNTEAETSRGKPKGTVGVALYTYVGNLAPTDALLFKYEGLATRAITEIVFPNTVPSGALVWVSGQWVNARGQTSVGSTPISFNLPGGNVAAAA